VVRRQSDSSYLDERAAGSQPWARRREAGDTLIEILVALVILSISVVAILGALTTTLSSSGEHRSLAADDTLLTTIAEQVKDVVELEIQNNPATWPSGCGGTGGPLTEWYDGYTNNTPNIPLPSPPLTGTPLTGNSYYPLSLTDSPYVGYVVNLTDAQYPNGSTWTSCPTSASADGVQEVTVKVTSTANISDTLAVVVRYQSDGNP